MIEIDFCPRCETEVSLERLVLGECSYCSLTYNWDDIDTVRWESFQEDIDKVSQEVIELSKKAFRDAYENAIRSKFGAVVLEDDEINRIVLENGVYKKTLIKRI